MHIIANTVNKRKALLAQLSLKSSADDIPQDKQRIFSVYIAYRLFLSVLLSILFASDLGVEFLGDQHPELFIYNSFIYIGFCCMSVWLYQIRYIQANAKHIVLLLIVDFIYLTILIYTSSSAAGGISYLLLIPMALGSTFLRGKTSIAIAAFASLLMLAGSIISNLSHTEQALSYFTAGITGIILFITAISFRLLSKKIQSSEHQIQRQIEHADFLEHIGQRIIESIDSGILVIDSQLDTLFINDKAKNLLSRTGEFKHIRETPELRNILSAWQASSFIPKSKMINTGVNQNIKIIFSPMKENNLPSLMLHIEDEREVHQTAQQLKLASLGRLTSSIAHEIRNPLGAISHASQLLNEADYINSNDKELLNMVQDNTQRINQTINNILDFSRRKQANAEKIELNQWLYSFKHSYQPSLVNLIQFNHSDDEILAYVDPNHLQQIMNNLVDNGIRHGKKNGDNSVRIEVGIDSMTEYPYINVIDNGDGVQEDNLDIIFEPFYTTRSSGSGLGLYLCKELCQANQANIVYLRKEEHQASCFRLILSKPS